MLLKSLNWLHFAHLQGWMSKREASLVTENLKEYHPKTGGQGMIKVLQIWKKEPHHFTFLLLHAAISSFQNILQRYLGDSYQTMNPNYLLHLRNLNFEAFSHHIIRVSPYSIPCDSVQPPYLFGTILPVLIPDDYIHDPHDYFHEHCDILEIHWQKVRTIT